MADWRSRDTRVRLFLAFLILVLVVVNSQSLLVSNRSRNLLLGSFQEMTRTRAEMVASRVRPSLDGAGQPVPARVASRRLDELVQESALLSICLMDWNGKLVAGSRACPASEGPLLEGLPRQGKRKLLEEAWVMSEVSPRYDSRRARAFGYLPLPGADAVSELVLRVEVGAPEIAEANRALRSTLIYQVSALTLLLLALVLFLRSLLAPHRRLVEAARSVAGPLATEEEDEGHFLLSTFQGVVGRLKEKEQQLAEMHRREKARADETEALATDIIRSMTTGLVSLDASGAVALVNPAAERIFRQPADAVLGRPFPEAFPGSPELVSWTEAAISQGEFILRRRVDYGLPASGPIHLGVSVLPLQASETGGVRGALCLLADLTEVIQLRERLFFKENLARLGEMAAGIAHEFRNSLATILGNAKLIKSTAPSGEAVLLAEALIDESKALSHVVTELLQFARPDPLLKVTLDLGETARDLAAELETRALEAGVRLDLDARPSPVEADEILLRKAITNLGLNAIEAAASVEEGQGVVRFETGREGTFAFVRVADNGPGIPKDDQLRIFAPFFTTKVEGTGLGLALVQKIALSHNGRVEVDSESGAGAMFTLKLPVKDDSSPSTSCPVGSEGIEDWL